MDGDGTSPEEGALLNPLDGSGGLDDSLDMSCKEDGVEEDDTTCDGGGGMEVDGRCALFGRKGEYTWDRDSAALLLAEDSSVCSRIFRFALARITGLAPQQQQYDINKLLDSLPSLHPAIVSLLLHVIEAEKVILPSTGAQRGSLNEDEKTAATVGGKKGKRRRRRVSFNTFDFSTIDTPDLNRKGSNKQMENLLRTLYQMLAIAEAVRRIACHPSPVGTPPPSCMDGVGTQEVLVGNEEPRASMQGIVAVLEEVGRVDEASENSLAPELKDLVQKEQGNWNEVQKAAIFYANELDRLCLRETIDSGLHGSPQSRLLERYFDSLSSLIRHELKRLLNVCSCGESHQPYNLPYFAAGGLDCCSAVMIIADTNPSTPFVTYNWDDPGALVHHALVRSHAYEALFTRLRTLLGGQRGIEVEWGEKWTSCEETEVEEPHEEGCQAAGASLEGTQEGGQLDGTMMGTEVEASSWVSFADSHASELLSYVGAQHFLFRILHEPIVAEAISNGKWGRVERFARMLHDVYRDVRHDEECLRPLGDLATFSRKLEEEMHQLQCLRERLQQCIPPEVAAAAAGQGNRRKRKRVQRGISMAFRELLTWVMNEELPVACQYPGVVPACIYAEEEQVEN